MQAIADVHMTDELMAFEMHMPLSELKEARFLGIQRALA